MIPVEFPLRMLLLLFKITSQPAALVLDSDASLDAPSPSAQTYLSLGEHNMYSFRYSTVD